MFGQKWRDLSYLSYPWLLALTFNCLKQQPNMDVFILVDCVDMNEETADNWEATKIIFVGDGAVGKTSILTRFQTVR